MKKSASYAGVFLILLGTLLLVLTRFRALTGNNMLLLAGLLTIICGIVLHLLLIKHSSKY